MILGLFNQDSSEDICVRVSWHDNCDSKGHDTFGQLQDPVPFVAVLRAPSGTPDVSTSRAGFHPPFAFSHDVERDEMARVLG